MAQAPKLPVFRKSDLGTQTAPLFEEDAVEATSPAPTGRQKGIAGGIRVGSSLLSSMMANVPGVGTLAAAGTGAIGEGLAEYEEGSPFSIPRIVTEAGLAAVPGHAYFSAGKIAGSALKSGLMTGVGEAARTVSKGENLSDNWQGILEAAGLGAITGGVFGRFLPSAKAGAKGVAPALKTLDEIVATHGPDAEKFGQEAANHIKREGWDLVKVAQEASNLEKTNPELATKLRESALRSNPNWQQKSLRTQISRLEKLGMSEEAQKMRDAAAATDLGNDQIYKEGFNLERKAKSAAKAKEEYEALKANGQVKETGSESISGTDPVTGRKFTTKQSVSPKDEDGDVIAALLGGDGPKKVAGVSKSGAPPKGPAKDIFDAWIKIGMPKEQALVLAAKGEAPSAEALQAAIEKDNALGKGKATVASMLPVKAATEAATTVEGALPVARSASSVEALDKAVATVPEDVKTNFASEAEGLRQGVLGKAAVVKEAAPVVDALPSNVAAPVIGASKATEDVANTLLKRALKDLNYSDEAIAKMAPEEAQALVAGKTVAPSDVVPAVTPKRGSPGEIKVDNVLSAAEKTAVVHGVMAEHYPPELHSQLAPLAQRYQELGEQIANAGKAVKGTPEFDALKVLKDQKGTIGMQMKVLTRQAEESGLIATGLGAEVSGKIGAALEDANASKFGDQMPSSVGKDIAAPPVMGPKGAPGNTVSEDLAGRMTAVQKSIEQTLADESLNPEARQAALDAYTAEMEALHKEMGGVPEAAVTVEEPAKVLSDPLEGAIESATARAEGVVPKTTGEATVPVADSVMTPVETAARSGGLSDASVVHAPGGVVNLDGATSGKEIQGRVIASLEEALKGTETPEITHTVHSGGGGTVVADGNAYSYDKNGNWIKSSHTTVGGKTVSDPDPIVNSLAKLESKTPKAMEKEAVAKVAQAFGSGDKITLQIGPSTLTVERNPQAVQEIIARVKSSGSEPWNALVPEGLAAKPRVRGAIPVSEEAKAAESFRVGRSAEEQAGGVPAVGTEKWQAETPNTGKPGDVTASGVTLGSGLGGFQSLLEKSPQLAARLGLAGAGALVGGVTDPLDDPMESAAAGAGIGFLVPDMIKGLQALKIKPSEVPEVADVLQSKDPVTIGALAKGFYHLLPNIQRFNYLTSSTGLPANIFAGPYGSLVFGAMSKALGGDTRGLTALKMAGIGNWSKEFLAAHDVALQRIIKAETGHDPFLRAEMNVVESKLLPKVARSTLHTPAVLMAAGDEASRKILMLAGFSENEAREMTLTSELYLPGLKNLSNITKGKPSPMMGMLFPFVRTGLNIMEQAATRFPGAGFVAQNIREKAGAPVVTKGVQVAQQGVSLGMMWAGYTLGTYVPADSPHLPLVRKLVSNFAGPFSALAAMGFAAGQTSQKSGDDPSFLQAMTQPGTYSEFADSLPLPTVQPAKDVLNFVGKVGSRISGEGEPLEMKDLPRGMIPAVLREKGPYGLGPEAEDPSIKTALPKFGKSQFGSGLK